MSRNKALLDSLMGAGRNMTRSEKAKGDPEWMSDNVCKDFLVGYCPGKALAKAIETERNPFDPPSVIKQCTKLHAIGLKSDFEGHKDFEKYRRKYEDSLHILLDKAIREVDDKYSHEKRRVAEGIVQMTDAERICDVCGLKYHLRLADVNIRETENNRFKPDIHPESPMHKGYVKLRQKEEELAEKIRARNEQKEDKDGDKDDGKDKEKDKDKDKEKDSKGSRDRDRRKRSRSRDRDRDRSRDGNRSRDRRRQEDEKPRRKDRDRSDSRRRRR